MKKKILATMLIAVMGLSLITGCGSKSLSGTVSTDGSTSMESLIGYLSEAYMEENSNVKVTYNPTGSGSGIQAVSEGGCDIGLSSRNLKDEEAANLDGMVIAMDGIAIIFNKSNTVSNLTLEQIASIYAGEITNWKEVGGEDKPIVCIGREAASGTRDGFESITGTKDSCVYEQELTSTGDVIQTVANNENAIGYASVASVGDTISVVSVNDVAQDFFDYCTNGEADDLIEEAGAVPVVR